MFFPIFIVFLTIFRNTWQIPSPDTSVSCTAVGGDDDDGGVAVACNSDATKRAFPDLGTWVQTLTLFSANASDEVDLVPANVESLTFVGNSDKIPGNAFSSFSNLRELTIDFSQAWTSSDVSQAPSPVNLDPNALKGLEKKLKKLELIGINLSGNKGLPPAIRSLIALQHLKLADCNLNGQIGGQDFAQMTELKHLEITNSPSLTVSDDVVSKNGDFLEKFLLDNVKLTAIPKSVSNLKTLTHFQIKNANVQKFPTGILQNSATTVKEISLSHSSISSIDAGSLKGMSALTSLDLSENQISTLPKGIFDDLISLESLLLNNNQLTTATTENAFSSLNKLLKLSLAFNRLDSITPGTLVGIENSAVSLYFSSNAIKTVKGTAKLTQTPQLDLASNGIDKLTPGFFDSGSAFSDLDLGTNPIASIQSGAFNGISVGDSFAIDDTGLAEFDLNSLSGIKGIQNLTISNNADLRSIKISSDQGVPSSLKFIIFDNNLKLVPTDSDGKLTAYLQKSGVKLIFLNKIYCHCQLGWLKNIPNRQSTILFSSINEVGEAAPTQCCNLDGISVDDFLADAGQCAGDKANAKLTDDDVCFY